MLSAKAEMASAKLSRKSGLWLGSPSPLPSALPGSGLGLGLGGAPPGLPGLPPRGLSRGSWSWYEGLGSGGPGGGPGGPGGPPPAEELAGAGPVVVLVVH